MRGKGCERKNKEWCVSLTLLEPFFKDSSPLPSRFRVVRWVSEKVLESYRNGITAGQKGATVIRKGESRRRGSFGKAAPKTDYQLD